MIFREDIKYERSLVYATTAWNYYVNLISNFIKVT